MHSQKVISNTTETFVIYVIHELCYCIICLHTGPLLEHFDGVEEVPVRAKRAEIF